MFKNFFNGIDSSPKSENANKNTTRKFIISSSKKISHNKFYSPNNSHHNKFLNTSQKS